MPKIFEQDGYKFFFYSNECSRALPRRRGSFEIERTVELQESQRLKVRELAKAEELATEHRELIIQRWNERFNR